MRNGNNYKILFSNTALKDKEKIINSGLGKKCQTILNLMMGNPYCYPPSYEKLSGKLSNYYSRRINLQHRLVYQVDEDKKEIHIIRMWTYYDKV